MQQDTNHQESPKNTYVTPNSKTENTQNEPDRRVLKMTFKQTLYASINHMAYRNSLVLGSNDESIAGRSGEEPKAEVSEPLPLLIS